MNAVEEIFEKMRQSGMNDWVGGGDPAFVSMGSFGWIMGNLALRPSDHVLDFGCGIGRSSVLIADYLTEGRLVGVDLIPEQIRFCQTEIAPRLSNTSFHRIEAHNPHYDHLAKLDDASLSENDLVQRYSNSFDAIIACSVFTHFDPDMAVNYLKLLGGLVKEGGHLCLTWFFDRSDNPEDKRLVAGEHFRNINDYAFTLFSPILLYQMVGSAGLQIQRISYGSWRGTTPYYLLKGQHYQDDIVLYRPTATAEPAMASPQPAIEQVISEDFEERLSTLTAMLEHDRAEFAEFRRRIEDALHLGWEEIQRLARGKNRK
jgi:SAM-dependent methyltransferase